MSVQAVFCLIIVVFLWCMYCLPGMHFPAAYEVRS
jgi:hypothetical protein